MKNYIKAINCGDVEFVYLKGRFHISVRPKSVRIFLDLQITKFMKYEHFENALNYAEKVYDWR